MAVAPDSCHQGTAEKGQKQRQELTPRDPLPEQESAQEHHKGRRRI